MNTARRVRVFLAILLGGVALAILPTLPAQALGQPTATAFANLDGSTVPFGSDWNIQIVVTTDYGNLDADSGTVNVLVKGVPGIYARGIPLTYGGVAYLAPPTSRPALAAGKYELSAVFVPSGGSGLADSQTKTPVTLTVAPIPLGSSFTLDGGTADPASAATILAKLNPPKGTSAPAGSWTVTATDSANSSKITVTAQVSAGTTTPTSIALPDTLGAGKTYRVTATFAPNPEVARGYNVTNPQPQTLSLPAPGIDSLVTSSVLLPTWAIPAIGVGFVALIVATIVLATRRRSKAAGERQAR